MKNYGSSARSSHTFSQVPQAEIPRSSFDRSHGVKSTFDSGYLVPVFVDEVLPGDTFNLNATFFARLATPLKPFMDNLYLDSFFFFVPNRLLWTNWEKFNGEQVNPGDSTSYVIPTITAPAGGYANLSLFDYLQLPTKVVITHSALWCRAYNLIWNEWFRDQNLQNSAGIFTGDGPDNYNQYILLRRGKRHDYFTSCLPWPQKGTAVSIPLTGNAPVLGIGYSTVTHGAVTGVKQSNNTTVTFPNSITDLIGNASAADSYPNIYADLSAVSAATINSLRQAFQIQKMFERDARGGTRYTEIIRSHFGVTSPDARLQRPEYLGGGSTPINVNPIAQTAPTVTGQTPQGNLAAMGVVSAHNQGFTKSFTEHGVLLGLVSVRADLTYQAGLPRMYSRSTRFDFYWPALSHLGEQAVLNQEIYAQGTSADTQVFGYQERYAEYRYKPSQICGRFRSNDAAPLDYWHLAQKFTSLPVLNTTFIQDTPPISRVVAVTTEPQFLFDAYFKLKCARPMPVYGVPGLIDHF